jgi:hypothetical protein
LGRCPIIDRVKIKIYLDFRILTKWSLKALSNEIAPDHSFI